MEEAKKQLESVLLAFKITQEEFEKVVFAREQLGTKLNENELVRNELDRLPADGNVYKAIGPALVKTNTTEAKHNIAKRIHYIHDEIKRLEEQIKLVEQKQDVHRENIQKYQKLFQQAEMKSEMKP